MTRLELYAITQALNVKPQKVILVRESYYNKDEFKLWRAKTGHIVNQAPMLHRCSQVRDFRDAADHMIAAYHEESKHDCTIILVSHNQTVVNYIRREEVNVQT